MILLLPLSHSVEDFQILALSTLCSGMNKDEWLSTPKAAFFSKAAQQSSHMKCRGSERKQLWRKAEDIQ